MFVTAWRGCEALAAPSSSNLGRSKGDTVWEFWNLDARTLCEPSEAPWRWAKRTGTGHPRIWRFGLWALAVANFWIPDDSGRTFTQPDVVPGCLVVGACRCSSVSFVIASNTFSNYIQLNSAKAVIPLPVLPGTRWSDCAGDSACDCTGIFWDKHHAPGSFGSWG